MGLRTPLAALAAGLLLFTTPLSAAAAAPLVTSSSAAAVKACTASMSVPNPHQHTTTTVRVGRLAGGARVTTVAHYKTTSTTHTATSAANGTAALPYKISSATKGFKVVVSVTAVKGSTRWSCSTAFVTR